jgi:hypothetical protein
MRWATEHEVRGIGEPLGARSRDPPPSANLGAAIDRIWGPPPPPRASLGGGAPSPSVVRGTQGGGRRAGRGKPVWAVAFLGPAVGE